jgi:hypothetical protein
MNELPRHTFWGAGEPDCPKELKAPNGELCTMRCKACGDGWRKSSDVCLAAHTLVPLEPASQEPQDYAPPLDDEGRLMTGTDHHYTAENVRSIIARLRRFASGSHESAEEFANLDWRGWSNVLWRVMSALAAEVPCPAQEPQGEAQPVARYTVEKQSGSEWARVVDRKTGEQVARYSVMPRKRSQRDGWKDAEQHAARLNAAIAAQPDPRGPQGEAQQPVSPQMQFTLIDAANTLKHAAEQATPDVAAAYKARAAEVFSVVASLAAQQPESRKPLTDEEVEPLFRQIKAMPITPGGIKDEWFWFAWGVEMGERAHGIGTGASKEVNDAA